MHQPKISSFFAARRRGDAQGTLSGTVRRLWPYLWPTDRADLKARAGLARGADDRLEAGDRRHPLCAEMGDRRARARGQRRRRAGDGRALRGAGAHRALRPDADSDVADPAGARRPVRGGGDERGAPPRQRSLRPPAPTVAALPPRAQDRRTDARSRTRPQRDRDDRAHVDADRGADGGRIRADLGGVPLFVRLALRRGDHASR